MYAFKNNKNKLCIVAITLMFLLIKSCASSPMAITSDISETTPYGSMDTKSPETSDTSSENLDSVLSHMRMVVKNGIKVKGTYSYSDGDLRKTIYYIADNKGYRITGEEVMPITMALNKIHPL